MSESFALANLIERFLVVSEHKYAKTTLRSYREALADLLSFCVLRDVTDIRQVNRQVLEQYQRHLFHRKRQEGERAGEQLSLGTQRRRITVVRTFFRFLVRQGVIEANPAADLDMPQIEIKLTQKGVSLEEIEQVLHQPVVHTPSGLRDRTMMEVLFATGIRRAELHALTLFDVDNSKRTLFVARGKGRRQRIVPISERALSFISDYTETARPDLLSKSGDDTGALWISEWGTVLSLDRIGAVVEGHVKAAKVSRTGGCHVFRHTFATLLLEGWADIRQIQVMLGHANMQTTALYTYVSIDQLVEVYERSHPAIQRPSHVAVDADEPLP